MMKFVSLLALVGSAFAVVPSVPTQQNGIACTICLGLGTFAIDEFEKVETVDQLEASLDGYCSDLPSILTSECVNLVNEYVPKIFTYLNQTGDKATATELCDYIDLCDNKASLIVKEPVFSRPLLSKRGIECDICEFVLKEGVSIIEQSESEADAQNSLDNECKKHAPFGTQTICEDLVNKYMPQIYAYVKANEGTDAEKVCAYIDLC